MGNQFTCMKCGHEWYQTTMPEKCPKCLRVNFERPVSKKKYIKVGLPSKKI